MIARATLAIMLACPTGAGLLALPHVAAARTTAPLKHPKPVHLAASRRPRHGVQTATWNRHGRRDLVTPVSYQAAPYTLDDGLAYDTPRGPDGRPLTQAAPIPLAFGASPLGAPQLGRAERPFQTGMASWYGGSRWQGHLTSSGGRYEQDGLTAAHATLPFGTQVRVCLVGSDRTVIVTITDRPGTRRRIIDLSRGAAAALGMLSRGIAEVSLERM